ncbi:hypothetical protein CCP4SC76_4520002 [Gammaproteobacteria bacterium]
MVMGVAAGSNGSFFISDMYAHRIYRVGPDGIITTIAGNGIQGFSGDGGPATAASLNNPWGVAVGIDGSVLIADYYNHRIRRVGSDGVITTIAGNGSQGFSGDGGPATAASLNYPIKVTAVPDGSVIIADGGNHRIRRIGPDGVITTIAGNGNAGFRGDGGPAINAGIPSSSGVSVASDGSILVSSIGVNRIRRIGTDGIIMTVAGNELQGFSGDGGPATAATLHSPADIVTMESDGSVLFADEQNYRIRRIGPDGLITTFAGNGIPGFGGDGGPATNAEMRGMGVASGADGSLLIAGFSRVRKISPLLPGFNALDISVASGDGRQLYRFDANGRHLGTVDTLTGATLYRFAYDSAGKLTAITDVDNQVTTIQRDGAGNPSAIVSPFGQRTTLFVDRHGYLASVTNPAGEAYRMQYTTDGLLTQYTDPRNHASQFTYEALGRLQTDINASGGSQTLSRIEDATGFTVTRTTVMNRTTTYSLKVISGNDITHKKAVS